MPQYNTNPENESAHDKEQKESKSEDDCEDLRYLSCRTRDHNHSNTTIDDAFCKLIDQFYNLFYFDQTVAENYSFGVGYNDSSNDNDNYEYISSKVTHKTIETIITMIDSKLDKIGLLFENEYKNVRSDSISNHLQFNSNCNICFYCAINAKKINVYDWFYYEINKKTYSDFKKLFKFAIKISNKDFQTIKSDLKSIIQVMNDTKINVRLLKQIKDELALFEVFLKNYKYYLIHNESKLLSTTNYNSLKTLIEDENGSDYNYELYVKYLTQYNPFYKLIRCDLVSNENSNSNGNIITVKPLKESDNYVFGEKTIDIDHDDNNNKNDNNTEDTCKIVLISNINNNSNKNDGLYLNLVKKFSKIKEIYSRNNEIITKISIQVRNLKENRNNFDNLLKKLDEMIQDKSKLSRYTDTEKTEHNENNENDEKMGQKIAIFGLKVTLGNTFGMDYNLQEIIQSFRPTKDSNNNNNNVYEISSDDQKTLIKSIDTVWKDSIGDNYAYRREQRSKKSFKKNWANLSLNNGIHGLGFPDRGTSVKYDVGFRISSYLTEITETIFDIMIVKDVACLICHFLGYDDHVTYVECINEINHRTFSLKNLSQLTDYLTFVE